MKLKSLSLLLLLSSLALLLTGCEWMRWLRLLSLKKQLAQLDRYVRVDDKNGLTIHFIKPVVYSDDIRMLMDGETTCTTNRNRITWAWTYEKQSLDPQPPPGDFDLSFSMSFENLKFAELFFPERFLAVLPKPMLLGMLRSVGQADVDMKRGTVKFKWAGSGKDRIELPTKSHVLRLLGPPFTITDTNQTRTFLYKYYQKTTDPSPPAERLAWAKFTFAADSDQMLSSTGCMGNMGWSMTSVSNKAEMNIVVSLVDMNVEPVALKLPSQITDDYVGHYLSTTGAVLNIGRDGDAFAAAWAEGEHGGWALALPELTNALFALPSGDPRWTFLRDYSGSVTGMVARFNGSDRAFTKTTNQFFQPPPVVQLAPQSLQSCAGTYKPSWVGRVFIRYNDGQLFWQTAGIHLKMPLYPSSETNFFFKTVDSPLTFVKDDKGAVTKFILHYRDKSADAEKLKSQ
jgi:hypothetical protein